jgi:hypothetical protein
VEILLWLVPSAVVTVLAMLWVGWLGREGRGEVDREVAVRRIATALEPVGRGRAGRRGRRPAPGYAAPRPDRDRSSGVAVRPSRRAS